MSWHYLQAQEAEFSVATYLDGVRSERLKSNPQPETCCSPVNGTESCNPSRFGTTFALSTAPHGGVLSMSSPVDSPVKTYPPQEKEPASPVNAPAFGRKCTESFARFDPDSRSWKTPQFSLLGALEPFSETWPKSGIMLLGWCWELTTWEPHTSAKEFGFSHMIPTPTACNAPNKGANTHGPKCLLDVARTGWNPGEKWPTPAANDGTRGPYSGREAAKGHSWHLIDAVKEREAKEETWPTPQASDYKRANSSLATCLHRQSHGKQIGLPETVRLRMLPTPTCQDSKNNGSPSQQNRNSKPLNAAIGGALNPQWVEWLMGWPIGWTDLEPLEMDKFHWWQQLHSASFLTV